MSSGLDTRAKENSHTSNAAESGAASDSGTVRRHQMRTVSKDDYLLARGANPRTGLVTPGNSLDSPIEEDVLLQARGIDPSSKWRQNGNQWISVGADQPTPLSRPPPLRRAVDPRDPLERIPNLEDNRQDAASKRTQPNTSRVSIPRKPVGSPPSRDRMHGVTQRAPRFTHDRDRSSSAPTPRKQQQYSMPDGVQLTEGERDHDNLRRPMQHHGRHTSGSFLGCRAVNWVEDVPEAFRSSQSKEVQKHPCRQMNGSQFQSQHFMQTPKRHQLQRANPLFADPRTYQRPRPRGPRTGDPSYPSLHYERLQVPPRHYHLVQEVHAKQNAQEYHASPNQPNGPRPLKQTPVRSMKGMLVEPTKMMPENGLISQHQDTDVFITPRSSTSMNTGTLIPTSISHRQLPQADTHHVQEMNMNMSLPMSRKRARDRPRPTMPARAEGVRDVPTVSHQHPLQNHNIWPTTMSESDRTEDRAEQPSVHPLVEQTLLQLNRGGVSLGRSQGGQLAQDPPAPLKRSCSHCRSTFSDARPRSTDGSTPMPGSRRGVAAAAAAAERNHPASAFLETDKELPAPPLPPKNDCPDCDPQDDDRVGYSPDYPVLSPSPPARKRDRFELVRHALKTLQPFSKQARMHDTSVSWSNELWSAADVPMKGTPEIFTPAVFWGDGEYSPGAVNAARAAMLPEENTGATGGLMQGGRVATRPAEDAVVVSAKRSAGNSRSAKTSRNVSWATLVTPSEGKRNLSGSSLRMINVPDFGSVTALFEMCALPVAALAMWLRQHPQVIGYGEVGLMRVFEMSRQVLRTSDMLWRLSYVYSKTGRVQPRRVVEGGPAVLVREVVTSALYVLVLVGVGIVVLRVLGVAMGVGRGVWGLVRVLGWVMGSLGLGR